MQRLFGRLRRSRNSAHGSLAHLPDIGPEETIARSFRGREFAAGAGKATSEAGPSAWERKLSRAAQAACKVERPAG